MSEPKIKEITAFDAYQIFNRSKTQVVKTDSIVGKDIFEWDVDFYFNTSKHKKLVFDIYGRIIKWDATYYIYNKIFYRKFFANQSLLIKLAIEDTEKTQICVLLNKTMLEYRFYHISMKKSNFLKIKEEKNKPFMTPDLYISKQLLLKLLSFLK